MHCYLDALILWIYTMADSVAHQLCRWVLDKTQWSVKTFGWATGGPEYCASRWTEFRYLGEQAWHLGGHLGIWASWESAVGSKWPDACRRCVVSEFLASLLTSIVFVFVILISFELSLSLWNWNCHSHCLCQQARNCLGAECRRSVMISSIPFERLGWYLGQTEIDWKEKNRQL